MMSLVNRRTFIFASTAFLASGFDLLAQAADETIKTEEQRGDATIPTEQIRFDSKKIDDLLHSKADFEPLPPNFGQLLVMEAQTWDKRSRKDNKAEITALLDLFQLPYEQNGKPVPFCAAGVSYVAAMVYAKQRAARKSSEPPTFERVDIIGNFLGDLDHAHFYPTPSVNDMYLVANGKHRWVPAAKQVEPKPGWLVVYHWNGGAPDHVGIVMSRTPAGIQTIEFNTSEEGAGADNRTGGHVAVRHRKYPDKTVMGFIRTT